MKIYAGIGSRSAGDDQLVCAYRAAKLLAKDEYMLRSGGAIGMDSAFEAGAGNSFEILRADDATSESIAMARQFHPAWHKCNTHVRKLLGRNAQIILGKSLDCPVEFVLYWCPSESIGGTSHALKIARANNIKTYRVDNWLAERRNKEMFGENDAPSRQPS